MKFEVGDMIEHDPNSDKKTKNMSSDFICGIVFGVNSDRELYDVYWFWKTPELNRYNVNCQRSFVEPHLRKVA
tara:strand:+ start:3173 stop:3391 length:219 start_codon:yes stop_codon:yes gene_type:complete